jgi:CheY-like chemotaxis protein
MIPDVPDLNLPCVPWPADRGEVMPAPPPHNDNRRRHSRREVLATAMVFTAHRMHGSFLVQDLSAGGACLIGHLDTAPNARLTLLLQFPGKTPFSVSAEVVRHDERGLTRARTAVAFIDLTADQEDVIQEAIATALERERARQKATVLVLAPDDDGRDALEQDLRALGLEPVGVGTPLEALAWLERPGMRISTVLVDVSPGVSTGLDVLDFLGEHYPAIQRVVMADEVRPFRLDLALRSGRAHRILRKPWDRRRLAEAMGAAAS